MKKTVLVVVSLFVLVLGSRATAQRWTPEQKEVLNHVEECWAAWADSVAAKDHSVWQNRCRPTDEFLWWWTSDAVPSNNQSLRRQFQWQIAHIKRVVWWDARPTNIMLVGDVAIVAFYAQWSWIGTDDKGFNFSSKRVEIFRKQGGQWYFLGGMVHREVDRP
jgi:ketosteroid isomerase-like protein